MEVGCVIGGKYRLLRKIGEGGMGAVWSAVHATLDRTVAIKFLRPSIEDAATASARFVAEGKSAARVKHRFVVDVFDFGISEDGVYYMVQELLEGEELANCMFQGPAWEVVDVVRFMIDCLSGLEAVHQAGIVHRDLKPENIFVMRESDGRTPKLLDFGISKMSEGASAKSLRPLARAGRSRQLTTKGTALGTPWYMSPEQLRGRRDLDGRADVYSLGVILYEWLTGAVPYVEENVAELALQVASGSAPPLVSLRPELGHGLSSVIARALAPERSDRFASASAMREALSELVPKLPQAWSTGPKAVKAPAPQAKGPGGRGARTEHLLASAADPFAGTNAAAAGGAGAKRRRVRAYLVGAAALLVLGSALLSLLRDARPERANAKSASEHVMLPPTGQAAEAAPSAANEPVPAATAEAEPTAGTASSADVSVATRSVDSRASTRGKQRVRRVKGRSAVIRTLDF